MTRCWSAGRTSQGAFEAAAACVAALSLDRNCRLCCQFSWALPNVQAAAGNYRLKLELRDSG